MLNRNSRIRLEDALSNGYFRAEDFTIANDPAYADDTLTRLEIRYRYNPDYTLNVEFNTSDHEIVTESETPPLLSAMNMFGPTVRRTTRRHPISGKVKPGAISDPEGFGVKNYGEFIEVVQNWLKNIKRDLDSEPKWRAINGWRAELESLLSEHLKGAEDAPTELLSKDEGERLRARLDDLEKNLTERLEQSVQDQQQLKRQVQDLHNTIEFLKAQTTRMDKRSFMKAFYSRFYGWFGHEENRQLMQNTLEITKLAAEFTKHNGS